MHILCEHPALSDSILGCLSQQSVSRSHHLNFPQCPRETFGSPEVADTNSTLLGYWHCLLGPMGIVAQQQMEGQRFHSHALKQWCTGWSRGIVGNLKCWISSCLQLPLRKLKWPTKGEWPKALSTLQLTLIHLLKWKQVTDSTELKT